MASPDVSSPARTSPDRLQRSYLIVAVDAPATSDAVGQLLRQAAARLEGIGLVDVQDLTSSAGTDAAAPTTALTVYYERVERRRLPR